MRHEMACVAVITLTGLLLHTVQLNISSRQCGYRVAKNLQQADDLRQVIGSRRDECRRLLEMDEVKEYVSKLGLTIESLLPPVVPEESYGVVAMKERSETRRSN